MNHFNSGAEVATNKGNKRLNEDIYAGPQDSWFVGDPCSTGAQSDFREIDVGEGWIMEGPCFIGGAGAVKMGLWTVSQAPLDRMDRTPSSNGHSMEMGI